jgi:hypothetical protein
LAPVPVHTISKTWRVSFGVQPTCLAKKNQRFTVTFLVSLYLWQTDTGTETQAACELLTVLCDGNAVGWVSGKTLSRVHVSSDSPCVGHCWWFAAWLPVQTPPDTHVCMWSCTAQQVGQLPQHLTPSQGLHHLSKHQHHSFLPPAGTRAAGSFSRPPTCWLQRPPCQPKLPSWGPVAGHAMPCTPFQSHQNGVWPHGCVMRGAGGQPANVQPHVTYSTATGRIASNARPCTPFQLHQHGLC